MDPTSYPLKYFRLPHHIFQYWCSTADKTGRINIFQGQEILDVKSGFDLHLPLGKSQTLDM